MTAEATAPAASSSGLSARAITDITSQAVTVTGRLIGVGGISDGSRAARSPRTASAILEVAQ